MGFLISDDVWNQVGISVWKESFFLKVVVTPFIVFIPLWWRFIQCLVRSHATGQRWPHLPNALKYGLQMTVTVFGSLHPLYTTYTDSLVFQCFWVSLFLFSTAFSSYWDIMQDWGLGKAQYAFLNDRQMYPRRFYYIAIVIDVCLRFLWIYTLVPPDSVNAIGRLFAYAANWLSPFAMVLEMGRRTMWGIFRLENEHLRNTEGYRKHNFVPLHFDRPPEGNASSSRRGVVLEVAGFAISVVAGGALILLFSSRRYDQHE